MCNVSNDSFMCGSFLQNSDVETSKRCVPTQTQIRQQLGSKLSDVFFEFVGNEGKAYLGLEPPLLGPDTVWISPNARLDNEVRVTPVPEPNVLHLKSLTHGSILDLGQLYIQKLENKHKMEMEEALKKQAEELEDVFRRRMVTSDDSNLNDGAGQCKKVVGTLMEHFDSCFKDLVTTTQLRMRKECQLKVQEERAEVASYMFVELQREIERRDMELCSEFHDILYSELNMLASRYIKQINKEREMAVELMRETVRNYEKMMQDIVIESELSSVVDVCRAITQERLYSSERLRELENQMRCKENDLYQHIKELKAENSTLQKMSAERLKRLMQWRKKVRTLLQEFQRFINFAMKAVPGQSEFLLNVEKLMLKKYPEDSFLLPEDYEHFKKCLEKKLSSDIRPEDVPVVVEPTEKRDSEGSEEEERSGEMTPPYCQKSPMEEGTEPGLTFDYDTFKAMMSREFVPPVPKPSPKRKPRKTVCLWKKQTKGVSIDKSSELYQTLTLAGEDEKQHLLPVNCFLHKRLKAVQKICEDDPEFATVILGCSNK